MKKKVVKIGLLSALLLGSISSFVHAEHPTAIEHGKHKTETFKVYGNCGTCEKTIEGSLKNVKGIDKADWNKETKMMEVTFDPEVITLTEIKQKIADVGYDTDEVRATDKAYKGLPGCCQYERPENNEDHHNHQH